MPTIEDDFEQLMQRVRAGCPDAAREMFERYNEEIQFVVRRRLSQRLRAQFDSLDFTQDAWASFFHIPAERYTFKTPEELVTFLTGIARNKLADACRQRLSSGKHNRNDVRALRAQTAEIAEGQPAARQPTPSQLAIAEEQWDRLLQDQPPAVRRALQLLREGRSHEEVADCLGVPTKMIQRVLYHLDRKLNLP
jgi:RNA polymerase sigma factor (sigma-70 family)